MAKTTVKAAINGGGAEKISIPIKLPTTSKSCSKKELQGLILGRYEVGKVLGHGTFAKVYLARNVKTNENVAIKVIDKEKILKVGLIAHIKREISILRRVRHPNIVQLFEVMATKSKIFFVMEYVKGGELFSKVARGRLKEDVARKYFQQLISAVSFCHARGVYHRDLKPENILLDENGNLKVSDFGLSAISDQIKQDGLFHTFCGTPAYVAPEVLARKGYDAAKVDIWSCGVILFVLMAGYLPFHDRNVMAMYKKIYRGEFKCPRWFYPELVQFFTNLLDINPQTRMTIPDIMNHRWFRKGFKQVKFYIEDDKVCNINDEVDDAIDTYSESESESSNDSGPKYSSLHKPTSLNAFDIISFSSGFDLSGLFEEGGGEARFLSGAPVWRIISKLEEIAKVVSFTVRKKNCRVNFEGPREGAKGPLTVTAEVFELTPSLRVVEVKKKAGDRSEYEEFYNSELKPVLQSLATEGASDIPEYTEFYNPELKPVLLDLSLESSPVREEYHEFCDHEMKPGLQSVTMEGHELNPGVHNVPMEGAELKPVLQNLAMEGDSNIPKNTELDNFELMPVSENLAIESSDRQEYLEFCDRELKPGLQKLAMEGDFNIPENTELDNFELKPVSQNMAIEHSDRQEYLEFCDHELKPGLQKLAMEGDSNIPEKTELDNFELKSVSQNLAIESSDRQEYLEFCDRELKPGLQNLAMEGASNIPENTELGNSELKHVSQNLAIERSNRQEYLEFCDRELKPESQSVSMDGPKELQTLAMEVPELKSGLQNEAIEVPTLNPGFQNVAMEGLDLNPEFQNEAMEAMEGPELNPGFQNVVELNPGLHNLALEGPAD